MSYWFVSLVLLTFHEDYLMLHVYYLEQVRQVLVSGVGGIVGRLCRCRDMDYCCQSTVKLVRS